MFFHFIFVPHCNRKSKLKSTNFSCLVHEDGLACVFSSFVPPFFFILGQKKNRFLYNVLVSEVTNFNSCYGDEFIIVIQVQDWCLFPLIYFMEQNLC